MRIREGEAYSAFERRLSRAWVTRAESQGWDLETTVARMHQATPPNERTRIERYIGEVWQEREKKLKS